jgi:RNA polymerase primary sigma factor
MTAKKSAPAKAAPAAPAKAAKAEAEDKKKTAKAAAAPAKPAAKAAAPVAEAKGKPGRKPKAGAAAAKKEEVPEEDFSDIEADLAGEPEVEAEGGEKAAKAKPLRMKVSRAKERALMREFGLDETALTEEEVAKRRQELKTLIKMGKTRGFLTHQEINDHLPEKLVDNEILEAIVSMLNDMGIAVYEQAPDAATLLIAGGSSATATEEEAEEAADSPLREPSHNPAARPGTRPHTPACADVGLPRQNCCFSRARAARSPALTCRRRSRRCGYSQLHPTSAQATPGAEHPSR